MYQVNDFCVPTRVGAGDSTGFRCAISGKLFAHVQGDETSKEVRANVLQACRTWVIGILEEQAPFLPASAELNQRRKLYKALNGTETPAPEYL